MDAGLCNILDGSYYRFTLQDSASKLSNTIIPDEMSKSLINLLIMAARGKLEEGGQDGENTSFIAFHYPTFTYMIDVQEK